MTAPTMRRRTVRILIAALMTACVGLIAGTSTASAGVAFGVGPTIPGPLVVGDSDVASTLTITNTSDGPEADKTVAISNITLVPTCGTQMVTPPDCPGMNPDPGVIRLDSPGFGRAGTACADRTFTISNIDPSQDKYSFVPNMAFSLASTNSADNALKSCIIDFTVDVLKSPTKDSQGVDGVQTTQVAGAQGLTPDDDLGIGAGSRTITIRKAPIVLGTVASTASPTDFTSFSDTATLGPVPGDAVPPSGTITFQAFGPNDQDCTGTPLQQNLAPVPVTDAAFDPGTRTSTVLSGDYDPPAPGTYRFVVVYSGDTNYTGSTSACNAENESVTIPAPQIDIVKTASPLTRPEPGGTFTFSLVVSNPSPDIAITITSLDDDIYGDLATRPGVNTCDDLIGTTLAINGGNASCSFEGDFTGAAGQSQTDVATVVGTDENDNTATDDDDAVVTLVPMPVPEINIVKTASPLSMVAPGGTFTFSLVISNPSPDIPITITSLDDDIYGNIGTNTAAANTCDDLIGTTLAAGGGNASCSFEGVFTGSAGQSQTDVVTVIGTDEDDNTATDDDDATVTLTPPPPPPPPPPAPAQAVAPVSDVTPRGTARIKGKTGCQSRKFNVLVSGRQIDRLIFAIDGKVVRRLSKPNSGNRFKLPVNPKKFKRGTHRVLARSIFRGESDTKNRTLRVVFRRCGRKAALPAFTG